MRSAGISFFAVCLSLAYRMASDEKKRELVKSLVENFYWNGEKLMPGWKNEFKIVANRPRVSIGSPRGNRTPITRMRTVRPNR